MIAVVLSQLPMKRLVWALIAWLAISAPMVPDAPRAEEPSTPIALSYMPAVGLGIPINARVPLDTIMGNLYAKGVGVPQDYSEAAKRFHLAADRGDATAQFNLGVMHANGIGLPRDSAQAEEWYRLAAAQGVADAQYNLALLYASGESTTHDDSEAEGWYQRAAAQGHARSQYNLAVLWAKGDGVPRNEVRAYMWFDLAATQFPASETEARNLAIRSRDLVAQSMTEEQIAEARRLAAEWTKTLE